jgi:hypothetical protein
MNYNNTNDVLDLAQRINMRRLNVHRDINIDTLLSRLQEIASQYYLPDRGGQSMDNISKARYLIDSLGEPSLKDLDADTNKLGVWMSQDLNKYEYLPEENIWEPEGDPNKYFYDEELIKTPWMPMSTLVNNVEVSDDLYPITTSTTRPHLNTALAKWYLNNGGKI